MRLIVLNSQRIFVCYILILMLFFFKSVNVSLLWHVPYSLIYILGWIVSLLYYKSHARFLITCKFDIILLYLFVLVKCYIIYKGIPCQYMLFAFCGMLPIILLIIESNLLKNEIFNMIVNIYCWILFISLIAWILFLMGIELPNFSTSWEGHYEYKNYFLFLYNKGDDNSIFPRFSSVFLEPGHLAMITSFILWVKYKDLSRFQLIILISSIVFSFSLAGYILCVFLLFFYLLLNIRLSLLIILFSIGGIIGVALDYVKIENSVFDQYILGRLQISDSRGIAGNNRTSEDFDFYYDRLSGTNTILYGVGLDLYKREFQGGNAGYKVFIVQYGYIGLILTFLFYFLYMLRHKSRLLLILFFLYGLSFFQRAYPFWEAWLIPYICSMGFYNKK